MNTWTRRRYGGSWEHYTTHTCNTWRMNTRTRRRYGGSWPHKRRRASSWRALRTNSCFPNLKCKMVSSNMYARACEWVCVCAFARTHAWVCVCVCLCVACACVSVSISFQISVISSFCPCVSLRLWPCVCQAWALVKVTCLIRSCNTLQYGAPHCTTVHHTATRRNTLQHTAIHCNTKEQAIHDTLLNLQSA